MKKKVEKDKPKNNLVRLECDGYFNGNRPWQKVTLEEAQHLTKKDVVRIWNRMSHRYFPNATI